MFFVFILAAALPAQPVVSESGRVSHANLKQAVLDIMEGDPDNVEPTKLLADERTVYYQFGGLKSLVRAIPTEPLDVPVSTQATVETVKRFGWRPVSRRIWTEALADVEGLISSELGVIAAHAGSERDLMKALQPYQEKTDLIFLSTLRRIVEPDGKTTLVPLERLASRAPSSLPYADPCLPRLADPCFILFQNPCCFPVPEPCVEFRLIPQATQTQEPPIAGRRVRITFINTPDDVQIFYMEHGRYRTLKLQNKASQDDKWCQVPTNSAILDNGRPYVFRAKRKGREAVSAKIIVGENLGPVDIMKLLPGLGQL